MLALLRGGMPSAQLPRVAGATDAQQAYQAAEQYLASMGGDSLTLSSRATALAAPLDLSQGLAAPVLPPAPPPPAPPPLPELKLPTVIAPPPVAPPAPPAPQAAPAPAAPAPRTEGKGPVLMQGHAGEPVKKLQERLKELGFDPGPADGIFGPKTLAAVKAFQQAKGLEVDGVVGKQTWGALGIVVTGQPHEARPASAPKYPEDANGVVQTPDGPMVRRQGKLIGAKVAEQFDRMVEAARQDGVTLRITSGYRSYDEQVVLWNKYGRNPARVARPGTSNHQKGEAIDFGNIGSAWSWLKQNAHRFGFKNYPPEPWHYSLNGR